MYHIATWSLWGNSSAVIRGHGAILPPRRGSFASTHGQGCEQAADVLQEGYYLDPKSMLNNGLYGCYDGFRAIISHTFGVQVVDWTLPLLKSNRPKDRGDDSC